MHQDGNQASFSVKLITTMLEHTSKGVPKSAFHLNCVVAIEHFS